MDVKDILKHVDHTLLNPAASWTGIQTILDDAVRYKTASACIPPSYVKEASVYIENKIPVCTVIGFPNGYQTTEIKAAETCDAVRNGASEIDMVINIGWLKDKKYKRIESEIRQIHDACEGKILKVIIETCLLTQEEKIEMCRIVTEAGAEYIKTSTGFAGGGATFEDVSLMKKHIGRNVKIKAAGGISSFEDAQRFLELGADRLGTSRLVKLAKEMNLQQNLK